MGEEDADEELKLRLRKCTCTIEAKPKGGFSDDKLHLFITFEEYVKLL
jgi:hypothetical protein